MRLTSLLAATVWATAAAAATASTNVDLTVYPSHVDPSGSLPSGVNADFPATWDTASWAAPGVTDPGKGSWTKLYLPGSTLFPNGVTIGDLERVTYWTKKDTLHTVDVADWFFQMYTAPFTGSPGSSWYGYRINSEPYFSANLNAPADQWNLWHTDVAADNRLRFYDSSNNYFGSYTDGFLQDLTANPTYSDEPVMLFAVGTGSAWHNGFTGQIDGLTIELSDGSVATVNFEVPEPASLSLLALSGLALIRRR